MNQPKRNAVPQPAPRREADDNVTVKGVRVPGGGGFIVRIINANAWVERLPHLRPEDVD